MDSDSFDRIEALKLRALMAAWVPDHDAIMRRIFRWYSREFHTPLHIVPDLPIEDVLQAWFEVQYEALPPEDKHNLAIYLLEDPEDRRKREAEDKNSDEEFYLMTKNKVESQKKLKEAQARLAEAKEVLNKISKPAPPPVAVGNAEEIVTVSFVDKPFDDEGDGLPAPPKRK